MIPHHLIPLTTPFADSTNRSTVSILIVWLKPLLLLQLHPLLLISLLWLLSLSLRKNRESPDSTEMQASKFISIAHFYLRIPHFLYSLTPVKILWHTQKRCFFTLFFLSPIPEKELMDHQCSVLSCPVLFLHLLCSSQGLFHLLFIIKLTGINVLWSVWLTHSRKADRGDMLVRQLVRCRIAVWDLSREWQHQAEMHPDPARWSNLQGLNFPLHGSFTSATILRSMSYLWFFWYHTLGVLCRSCPVLS